MDHPFTMEMHYMIKAVWKAGILFPASKDECLAKAGDLQVKTGWDQQTPLKDLIAALKPSYFDNATHFYNAYVCSRVEGLAQYLGVPFRQLHESSQDLL